ncbi:MAG TPA: alpha/beta hydrolase [Pseudonocardiaceae bacterium]|nr:alpha/beta hydrolase [Pseudonocardiaceae bacterium]
MEATTCSEVWDRQYLPGRLVPSEQPYLDEYTWRSALARRELSWREVRYGSDPSERLHFFPAPEPDSPLVVFVHGGYWQQLTEADSSFAAREIVAAGAAYAALGYGLAPRVGLDDIVAMVRNAVLWLHRNAAGLGVDRKRIILTGHSAGAQLAGMCLVEGWLPEAMRPRDLVCAAVLMSGLYELEPVRRSSVGAAIGLSATQAATNSLLRQLHAGLPPLVVARGANEPIGFADQQRWLVSGMLRLDVPVTELVVAARNHFDLPLGMGDPADAVGRALLAKAGLLQEGTGN